MLVYQQVISSVKFFLKEFGFRKQGESFILRENNNIGIINLQKSRNSSASDILFTINIGVYLTSLAVFNNINMLDKPIVDGCHWKERVNPTDNDSWWHIYESTSFENLNFEVLNVLKNKVLPQIKKFIVDENLEKAWLSGISGGLSIQQRQLYLIALLKRKNSRDSEVLLEQLMSYSKGKSFEHNILENIAKLYNKNE